MIKQIATLVLSITFAFPMIKDGNVVYNANYITQMWQNNKFVFMRLGNRDNMATLSFDSPFEANCFLDHYASWLARKK